MGSNPKPRELGALVKRRRQKLRLSATAVADKIGRHHSAITKIERGEAAKPEPDTLDQLALALGLDIGELYALAGHTLPEAQLDLSTFLHVKHRDLPTTDVDRIALLVEEEILNTRKRTQEN